MKKGVIAITGASGAVYAESILKKLTAIHNQWEEISVVMSTNAQQVWKTELDNENFNNYPLKFYTQQDFFAPFASGSANFDAMIICPCSMGTLGRIAHGYSNDLISRAADVMLKEKKTLIIVPREMPYNLIHLENFKLLASSGAIICPASPSYYSKPQNVNQLVDTVVDKILKLTGFQIESFKWGESEKKEENDD